MKKHNIIFLALAVFSFVFLNSCHDAVFYYINNDVVSEDASVNGIVRSIARYTTSNNNEYIVTVGSDGFLYKLVYDAAEDDWTTDTQKHGAWTLVDQSQLPFTLHKYDYVNAENNGQQIIKIIADSNTLYLFTVEYTIDEDEGTSCPENIYVWAAQPEADDSGSWKTLTEADWTEVIAANGITLVGNKDKKDSDYWTGAIYKNTSTDYYYTNFTPFFTNAPQKANRFAYFRTGNTDTSSDEENLYYQLSGTTATKITIDSIVDSEEAASASEGSVKGAAYFDGGVKFFTTSAVTTNESKDKNATVAYWGNGSYLDYAAGSLSDTSNIHSKWVSTSRTITSLAFCSDTLLIAQGQASSSSCSGGIQKVDLDSGDIPQTSLGTFTTNAQTQLLTSYMLSVVFNTNPADAELDSSLYAGLYFVGSSSSGSVSFSNVGLWSYYPSRGNWNRE